MTARIFARFLFESFICARLICRSVVAVGLLLALGFAAEEARSQPGMSPTAATRHEVWQAVVQALRARSVIEKQLPRTGDLDLPGALPSLAGRSLSVTTFCWDERSQRLQFRVECGEAGQCLPFLAYLRKDASIAVHNIADSIGTATDVPSCQAVTHPNPVLTARTAPASKSLISPGEQATAVFVSANFRMTASVTCLDRGREGEIIRVRNQNGQIFRARISGPAQLEALAQ